MLRRSRVPPLIIAKVPLREINISCGAHLPSAYFVELASYLKTAIDLGSKLAIRCEKLGFPIECHSGLSCVWGMYVFSSSMLSNFL